MNLGPRRGDERGVTAVLIAVVVVVLFGFTALTVDVGRAYMEKRELQTAADASAMSAAQLLMQSEAAAETLGQYYVTNNPTVHHPGAYNALTGDLVDGKLIANGTGCTIDGVTYDCIESTVVAPAKSDDPEGFEWIFAAVLGFDEIALDATATAVLGGGAPGGEKLVPWVVIDCPTPSYEGSDYDAALAAIEALFPGRCPYEYSNGTEVYEDHPRVDLFLDTNNPNGEPGNFQGADLAVEPCPPPNTPDGLFPKGGGGAEYRDVLSGLASPDEIPCTVGRGARLYTKTGIMTGPTGQGLDDRGVDEDTCANEASFNSAVEDPDGDGIWRILDHSNPCLIDLILSVHVDETYPGINTDIAGGPHVMDMQHPQAIDTDADEEWRFASIENGSSSLLLARRFATFYITDLGGPQDPYKGIFMRALDSGNASLDGTPCSAEDGVCVVKLVG